MVTTILKGIERITTPIEFELLKNYIDSLINEATAKGHLAKKGANNTFTQEIARLVRIGASYEDEFLQLAVGKSPLIKDIEVVIKNRGITQKKAAELVGVNEVTFSGIMRGKQNITMRIAKGLVREFQIDPNKIIQYS